jgi:Tfp pilus assembly protein PilF
MTTRQRLLTIPVILLTVFFTTSCATTNWDQKKEQGSKIRIVAEVHLKQGNYRSALKDLQKAQQYYADDPFLHNDFGLTYFAMEKFDLSIHHFKTALELKPNFASAQNSLGKAYFKQKYYDKAIETLKKLTTNLIYATPHYPLANLGEVYYEKQDYGSAEKYFKAALKIEPHFAFALQGLGKTYLASGKLTAATVTLEKAVTYAPKHTGAYFYLADVYTRTGDYTKALSSYKKIMELSPDSELAIQAEKMAGRLPTQK